MPLVVFGKAPGLTNMFLFDADGNEIDNLVVRVRATNSDDQRKIAEDIQKRVMEQVTYIPLGQFVQPSVWRKSLKGVLDGPATPVFWNIEKTGD